MNIIWDICIEVSIHTEGRETVLMPIQLLHLPSFLRMSQSHIFMKDFFLQIFSLSLCVCLSLTKSARVSAHTHTHTHTHTLTHTHTHTHTLSLSLFLSCVCVSLSLCLCVSVSSLCISCAHFLTLSAYPTPTQLPAHSFILFCCH